MEDQIGFESQLTSVMQNVLKSAVCEATKLFERTLQQLKAELVHLRAENVNLKTAAYAPYYTTGGDGCPKTDPAKRDIGVQCEKPTMVERCSSPAHLLGPITNDRLTDLCACSSEDGNRQLALLLIKKEPQETDCDEYAPGYFLLKQEGAEPILVRRDPFKNTMERVEIPSALRGLSRCYQTGKTSIPETTTSCSFRAQMTSKQALASQSETENSAPISKTSGFPELQANPVNRQTDILTPTSSPGKPSLTLTPRIQQMTTTLEIPSPQQIFHDVQHLPPVTRLGPKVVHPPLPLNKNSVPGIFHSQSLPIPVTTTSKIPRPAPVAPSLPLSQTPKHSLSPPQTQNITVLGHMLGPRTRVSFPTGQHTGQGSFSHSHNPIQVPQVSVPPVHHVTQPVPPAVPHHQNLPSLSQPNYPLNHVPFGPAFLPVQSTKPSASPISQTNVSSGFEMLSDPLCSSSEALFPTPDDTDPLQALAPLPFPSPLMLTQQETSNMTLGSQGPGQSVHLAPLLTPKERQEAVCSRGDSSKRGCSMAVEIPVPTSSNFDQQVARFQPLESPTMDPPCSESIGIQIHDPVKNICMPGSREQFYTVLSKPGSPFTVPDSTVRMNIKDLRADQQPSGDATCQVWDVHRAPDFTGSNAPAPNTPLKAPRKVLEKKTECSECGRILSNPSSLENHMRLHRGERPYTCSQCGKAFPSVRGLNRHVKVHAEEKGYSCEVCGRSFVYQFTLTKHKLIHSGDRPFPCKVCGKKFLAKADRATHMRMHTGEKPFFCSQCGKSFKHRVALNMHLQGHRGEKRYVCPHCEKGFVDLGNFKRHKRIHTGEKPFECKVCGKRFTQSAHLKKHVNTQHLAEKQNTGRPRGPGSEGPVVESSSVMEKQLLSSDPGEPSEINNVSDVHQ